MTKHRPLALGAAVTIGFGSLFLAAPAFAEGTDAASLDGVAAALNAVSVLSESTDESVDELAVAVGENAAGAPVLLLDEAKATEEVKAAAAKLDVSVGYIGEAVAQGATDVVGGAGYYGFIPSGEEGSVGTCSVGFTGFSPAGAPALITAGHCQTVNNLDEVSLSLPSADAAGGSIDDSGTGVTGEFGFAQFGGPGNSVGAKNDPKSTDIAVIDVSNVDLKLLPEVTDWSTAADDDLAASATKITGVADPVSGTVSKSGRTTGLTTGETRLKISVEYEDGTTGVESMEILDGYMQVSGKWVHGFMGGATTSPGDSGGAVFQGTNAVGVVSGGPSSEPEEGADDWAWYTRLADALEFTGGYEVAVHVDAPTVDSPAADATVEPSSDIVVSAPGADTLFVAGESIYDVPVVDGKVTLQAPEADGEYSFILNAGAGLSSSESTVFDFTVKKSLAAPTITGQNAVAAEGKTSATFDLSGTGIAGADVKINDLWETKVGDDGKWTFADVSFDIGENTVTAKQTVGDEVSAAGSAVITVTPAAAGITSIKPNQSFANADAPAKLSGTGLADAEVRVTVDAAPAAAAAANDQAAEAATSVAAEVGADGKWTVDLGGKIAAGTHTVTAVQKYNGIDSAASTVVFTVEVAPAAPVDPADPVDPVNPTDPGTSATPSTPTAPGGQLPVTGGLDLMPLALTAFGLLVLGGGATLIAARKLKPSKV